ncbi:enoyl-CoA hydratase/isomerase family protein [Haloechinothrix sp. YIM 98757]|uniref:Enoyl-CoA hydratase/isomerase family protein n=1 Tax=Haloechinothrix aidingensis TaxID=2752311 RepID=A0A838AC22_9PSEU|nr:enoyl-CoA hydratase/isomerase family protein [Haloechinothrix aidingensis]MBA0126812.1 enoyl-CoA hydratase/isomerase family protein [Haloechinothrix aidingensis]
MSTQAEHDSAGAVRTRREGAVGYITLDRPDAMNAVTIDLARGLDSALRELGPDVAAIVIEGAGGNFCAGGDVHEVQRLSADGPSALRSLFEHFHRACSGIARLSVPVIAAVRGYAVAGGFELMQACDIALVAEDARIADHHVKAAQVPGGGGSQRLPRLVGKQRALGHLLTGDRISGEQAVEWGLAYRCVSPADFDAEVRAFATHVASMDRETLGTIKRLVHQGSAMSLDDGLALETATVVEHITTGASDPTTGTSTTRHGSDHDS